MELIQKKNELKIILKCNNKTVDLKKFLLMPSWRGQGLLHSILKTAQELS